MNRQQMTFNGVDFKAHFAALGYKFSIEKIAGRGLLNNNVSSRPVPGDDGELFLNKSLPARVIEVSYNLIADDAETLRDAEIELNRLLQVETPKPLSFEDQDGYFVGIHTGAAAGYDERGLQKGTIEFYCSQPFLYRDSVTVPNVSLAANATHSFDVETNYKNLPVITFTVTSATTVLTITTNGRALTYTGAIAAGTVIKIDGVKKEFRMNNVLKVIELDGWFPYFIGGTNAIKTSAAGTLGIAYQERFV